MTAPVDRAIRLVRLTWVAAVVGGALTAAVTAVRLSGLGDRQQVGVVTMDDLHEGQVEFGAALVLILVAAVIWGRVHRLPSRRQLALLAAVSVLALDNLLSAMLTAGYDSLSENRFATWCTAANGLLGAALLLTAGLVVDSPVARPGRAIKQTLAASTALVVLAVGAAWLLRDTLPAAFSSRPVSPEQLTFLIGHPALIACQVLTALCWAGSAGMFAVAALRTREELTGWIALASVTGAISFVNYALVPSQFTELLYLGDYFFLVTVVVLLIGAVREVGAAEAARVDRAIYSERLRIARELHDGVAQELSLISAQTHGMLRRPLTRDVGLRRVQDSVDRALDESRAAISELSGPVGGPLASALAVTAEGVTRRAGVRLDLDLDDSVTVSSDLRVALSRTVREAIGSAVRNGGARRVGVRLWKEDGVRLRIALDGDDPAGDPVVLASLRERLALVGATLEVGAGAEGEVRLEVRLR
jgi:signal transduction histidine kinase